MNEVVKYHNDFSNKIILKSLNANELNFLMAICSKLKDKENEEMTFTFLELKELVNWKSNDNVDFVRSLKNTNEKLLKLNFTFEDERYIIQFVLFPTFKVDKDNNTLTVQVHKDFSFLLNNLTSNFTVFELSKFINLKSKYTKYLYRELMKFKSTRCLYLSIEDFRNKLDIPKTYRMSDINKYVLKPIEEELSKIFASFSIEKIKYKKRVTRIVFYFTPREITEKNTDNIQEVNIVQDKKIVNQNTRYPATEMVVKEWISGKNGLKYNDAFVTVIEDLKKLKYTDERIINYLDGNYNYVFNLKKYKDKDTDEKNAIFVHRVKNGEDVPNYEKEKKHNANKIKEKEEYKNKPSILEDLANNMVKKETENDRLIEKVLKLPKEEQDKLIKELKETEDVYIKELNYLTTLRLISFYPEFVQDYIDNLENSKDNDDDDDDDDIISGIFVASDNTQSETIETPNYKYDIEYIKEALNPKTKLSFKTKSPIHVKAIYNKVEENLKTNSEKRIFEKLKSSNEIDELIDFFEEYFLEVFNNYFGKGHLNTIKNVKKTELKVVKQGINNIKSYTFRTIDEAIEYIKNNLTKFENELLSKNGTKLKGAPLNLKINKLAEKLISTQK